MMEILLEYLFLLCSCATAGWILEFIYRGICHQKVVNPGFLTGSCLKIYGVGGAILYFLSGLKLRFLPNEACRVAVILVLAMLLMTLIELIGGLISLKYFRVRLWDYSKRWLNYKGVICPLLSAIWGAICAGYYFFLYPSLHKVATRVIDYPWAILLIGIYVGIFLVDFCHSIGLMQRLRAYAGQLRTHLSLDQIKANAKEYFKAQTGKAHAPLNFHKSIAKYLNELRGYRDEIQQKWGKKK